MDKPEQPSETYTSRMDIIGWWEQRRLRFNAYVGLVGFVTWWLVLIAGSAAVKPGVDFEEPFGMILGPLLYGIMANVCYTFGWIVDIAVFRGKPRKALFRGGFIFSVLLTSLPGIWAVIAWLTTVYTGRKLN